MKQILFIILLGLVSTGVPAQTSVPKDSPSVQDTPVQDGEAGGISAADADTAEQPSSSPNWLLLALSAVGGAVVAVVVLKMAAPAKKQETITATAPTEEIPAEAAEKAPKISAAELKKIKQELKVLSQQVENLKADNMQLEQNLSIYRNFDSSYFGEAFRKLTMPMNEALEKGSRKEIIENLLKIMSHFTSLTRYKISKKQPYDEANIHYLLNQKGGGDGQAIEINGTTPIDKIPKNIKTITDLLKEQDSKGLDEAIIAGYKIKNL